MKPPIFRPAAACLLAAVLLTAGCESRTRAHLADRLEEERKSIPPMAASDTFFGGQVSAAIELGSGLGGLPGARRHGGRGKGFNPKFMGIQAGGGDYASAGSGHEPDSFGFAPADHLNRAPMAAEEEPHMMGESPMPPVVVQIRLENTSSAPIEVEFVDFASDLGDFAVQPEKMKLAPGESATSDPMTSRLGLTSYALPITVALRVNRKTERKVITLKPVPGETQTAPEAPPASAPQP